MPHPPLLAQQQYPYRLPPGTSPNASESGPPPDQLRDQQQMGGGGEGGKRNRRPLQRKTIDYYGAVVRALETRIMTGTGNCQRFRFATPCVADPSYIIDLAPPRFIPFSEAVANLPTRLVQQAQNKARCPVNVIRWTPEGRRLLTGSSSGEFTMWNGLTFNFETIMQAHDKAVRAMEWSHNGKWL
ncbi:pre-mRNA cleavage and polyadenylation factor (CPF) complex subunit, partial [Spiromyces aspiralis]